MRKDKNIAYNLRKQGKSYSEISKELDIPKSTLACWFKGNIFSEEIKKKLITKAQIRAIPQLRAMASANKVRWEKWHEDCRREALEEFPKFKDDVLFIAGLMLYWGEGDKVLKNGLVRLANSDPEMIRIFYFFLVHILIINKQMIFFKLTLYPDLKDSTSKKLWAKMIHIPIKQFKKSAYIEGRHPEKRLSYGVCTVEICSRKLKEKILMWIKLYQDSFGKTYEDDIIPL